MISASVQQSSWSTQSFSSYGAGARLVIDYDLCTRWSAVMKVGREVARLAMEESNDVSVETRKGLYGNCDLYVFCWYVCRLFVMNYGAVSTNQDDPFCFQRIL